MTGLALLLPGPMSGRRTSTTDVRAVADRLRAAGWTTTELLGLDEADTTVKLRAALADASQPVAAVVVLGGDGMVNLAIQEMAGTDVPLGIVPVGTGNDFARALGIPRGQKGIDAACDLIVAGGTRRLDLGLSDGRYFATVMAAGLDAVVNEYAASMRWPRGNLKYSLAIVPVLARFKPMSFTLTLDGSERSLEAVLVSVGNTNSVGGGLRIAEGADPADGLLDVIVFHTVSKFELLKTYPRLFSGTHTNHPAYERIRVRSMTVATPGVVAYADGERFGPLPRAVEVAPGALSVFVPQTAALNP